MRASKRILIVEDEEILADNIKAFLRRSQCDVRVATSGHLALGMLDDFDPEVVILDYHLPGMNGFQTLDAIRLRRQDCNCVLITGHPSDEVHAGVRQRGIREVLFKPFPLDDLAKALNRSGQHAADGHAAAPATADSTHLIEHRDGDRRRNTKTFSLPFRLPGGGWLFADRRRTDRRA